MGRSGDPMCGSKAPYTGDQRGCRDLVATAWEFRSRTNRWRIDQTSRAAAGWV